LVLNQVEFEKTHDVGKLLALLESTSAALPEKDAQPLKELTRYAVETRYPPAVPTAEEAKNALRYAEKFLRWVRSVLPPEV
jgi:HEPN domain-containing protein